ncbi:ABC transporter ATP-binding protein [Leptolyngbya sp. AN02str]
MPLDSSTPEVAIRLQGVSKAFAIYNQPSDRLKQLVVGDRKQYYREFWAVRSIDLEVYRGETVGILGRNGAGKSTLLQLICGTLQPTHGQVTVNGRIAALLELGSGFNPEFTGRDNVFMNASILGLSRSEIERRFDTIAAFADIGDFIEQPVKSYSSGMYARLAFAVAINVDPDILIVDEALSVGDEAFQRKCYSRLDEIRKQGSTILFVSHSASRIVELCDRAILLDKGERLLTATPKIAVSKYQKLIYAPTDRLQTVRDEIRRLDQSPEAFDSDSDSSVSQDIPSKSGSMSVISTAKPTAQGQGQLLCSAEAQFPGIDDDFDPNLQPKSTVYYTQNGAEIYDIKILNQANQRVNILTSGHLYRYTYKVNITQPAYKVRCGMMIKSVTGIELGGIVTHPLPDDGLEYVESGSTLNVTFHFQAALSPGVFFLNAGTSGYLKDKREQLHRITDALMFRIAPIKKRQTNGYIDFSATKLPTISINKTLIAFHSST